MKKQTQKYFLAPALFLLTGLFTHSYGNTDILELPSGVTSAPKNIKNELYGPEITSCQAMSGEGWKSNKPDFNEYAKREIKDATLEFNKNITEVAPSLSSFLGDLKISQFINLDSYQVISDGYIIVKDPDQSNSMGAGFFILKKDVRADEQYFVDDKNPSGKSCQDNNLGLECYEALEGAFSALSKSYKFISEKEVVNLLKKLDTIIGIYKNKYHSVIEDVAKCSALYSVVSNGPSKREMDLSEYNKSQESKSYDGALKCSSLGYETQDYKACAEAVTYYDAVFIGRKAVETAQSFQYMDKSMDIQTEMAQNAQTDATAGLKAQKADIQQKADLARTRAATETAAVGALWMAMQQIPTIDELHKECESRIESANNLEDFSNNLTQLYTSAVHNKIGLEDNGISEELLSSISTACATYVRNTESTATHSLIQNGGAKDIVQQALIDAGVNIATTLGTAEILDKQASRVGDAIKLVDDYDPESLAYDSEDLLATECQVNPGSENCVSAQYERGVDYYNDGINVEGMQFATSDSTLPIDEYDRNTDAVSDSTDRSNTVGGIGATVNPVDKGSGLADSPIGAASVSSTGSNGIGSGGGGRGGGGGGASAPANGSASTGGQGASKPYVGSSKKLSYSSSGSGLSFSSGSTRTTKKSKAENPFSKLFGKKTAKTDGVLNFRGVASDVGSKNGSIFQMISKRYSAVSKDKRLEEYQKVNK